MSPVPAATHHDARPPAERGGARRAGDVSSADRRSAERELLDPVLAGSAVSSEEARPLVESGGCEERQAACSCRTSNIYELAITLLVCTLYMLVGPLLIMSNKYLLTAGKFHYPIILTTMHQAMSAVCCAVLLRGCKVVPLAHDVTWQVWRTNILAVGVMMTAALCTGNASYLYLTVAFVEILKGFTPVVTMMVQSLFGEPLPTCKIAACVLMISLGTAISSFGEMHLDLTGLLLMLLSVYCEATRLMLTQRLLRHMDFHVLEGLYYMSPTSALCAFAVALVVEVPRFHTRRFVASLPDTWHLFLANALLGFLVNGKRSTTHAAPSMQPHNQRISPLPVRFPCSSQWSPSLSSSGRTS